MSSDAGNQFMNELLRSRSTPSFGPDATNADVNRAIRELAGYPTTEPEPRSRQRTTDVPDSTPDPRSAARRLLAEATTELRDSEPLAGVASEREWEGWLWTRAVVRLIDQAGLLPGERGYNPATAASIVGADFDMDAAMAARRQRWQALGRSI